MPHRPFPPAGLALVLMLAVPLTGCSRATHPVAPGSYDSETQSLRTGAPDPLGSTLPEANEGFYPLDVGNWWHYRHTLTVTEEPAGAPPGDPLTYVSTRQQELVCVQDVDGRDYVVESHQWTNDGVPDPLAFYLLYRQDRSGLYESAEGSILPPPCLDLPPPKTARIAPAPATALAERLAASVEPARRQSALAAFRRAAARLERLHAALGLGSPAALVPGGGGGGPLAGEITRLRYPLRAGTRWVIRDDPSINAVVERAETLDLPIGRVQAWRIRIEWPDFGISAHAWYGASGYLALDSGLIVEEMTDDAGNPVGTLTTRETEVCDEIRLVTPGRLGSVAASPTSPWAERPILSRP